MNDKQRPAPGLIFHVRIVDIRDADTPVVSLPGSSREWAIRLIDCWAPEGHTREGKEATAAAKDLIDFADPKEIVVHIPEPKHVHNLLRNLTFDRIPGWIWLSTDVCLNRALVEAGHATEEKPKKNRSR